MKPLLIVGIVLVVLGVFVVVARPSMGSQRSVMRVGDVEVSAEGQQTMPPWVGWAAIVSGAVLVGGGVTKGRKA
jgi:uncharacterized membrane protein